MTFDRQDQVALLRQLPDELHPDSDYLSEEAFLEALSGKVAYMLQYNSGVLFQWLYKIDVLEPKLNRAMQSNDVPMAIAVLILERQLESLASRKAHPPQAPEDKDLEW